MLHRVVIRLVVLMAASAASAAAQDAPPANTPPRPPHRFFDRTNVALIVVESSAMIADGITTQHLLKADPTHAFSREADPLARPFVYAGWPGQIAGGALAVSGEVGLRYWLHRKNHHRIERWLPMYLTVSSTIAAIHNAKSWGEASRLIEQQRR